MIANPWNVLTIEEFSYFNCPECFFRAKELLKFEDHATMNHPLSFVLFGESSELMLTKENNDLKSIRQFTLHHK